MWRLGRGTKRTEAQAAAESEVVRSGEPVGSHAAPAASAASAASASSAASAASAHSALSASSARSAASASDPDDDPGTQRTASIGVSVAAYRGVPSADEAPVQEEGDLPLPEADLQPLSRADRVGGALDLWTAQIAPPGARPSFLTRMRSGEHVLDLTHAHPSGLAQLLAGRGPTRLSSLVREVDALAVARVEARAIREVAERQADEVGVTTCHLGIGEAVWFAEDGSEPFEAPILIRPLTLRLRGTVREDVDLDLDATSDLNPVLLRALRDAGVQVDPRALLESTQSHYGFDPTPVLEAFRELGQVLPGFRVSPALVVGNLMDATGQIVEDLRTDREEWTDSALVAALAGDPEARSEVRERADQVWSVPELDETEMVTALSPDRAEALRAILAGGDLAVTAPPGSDPVDLVVDLTAELTARGRTVLVVSQRSGHLAEIAALSSARGLEDVVLDLSPSSSLQREASATLLRGLRGAGSYEPPVDAGESAELVESREILAEHVTAMHSVQLPWRASAHEAISALAALTRLRPAPATSVRLRPQVAATMIGAARERYAESLREAARIGALSTGPEDTAWYGSSISSDTQAEQALKLVGQLRETLLPQLRRAATRTGSEIGLRDPRTLVELQQRRGLLERVGEVLVTMHPTVFTADLDPMIAATAPSGSPTSASGGAEASSWSARRRLRRSAADLQRPGQPASDLHSSLRTARAVREEWDAARDERGGTPRGTERLEAIGALAERMQGVCDSLAVLLSGTPAGGDLATTPFDDLAERAEALHRDRADLADVPRRTALLRSLAFDGLGDLVEDLRSRRVAEKDVASELDLAWWATVLELIARAEPTLAQYDGTRLSEVAERYREADAEHLRRSSVRVRQACDERLVATMTAFPDTSRAAIRELARSATVSVRDLAAKYEDIMFAVRPAWLSSPYQVPQVIPRGRPFDVVILADGGSLPTAAALPAIVRARQTVVLGDPLVSADLPGSSVLDDVLSVAGHVGLRRDGRPEGSVLRAFAQRRSLSGPLHTVPSPSLPEPDRLVLVPGAQGPVTAGRDVVESTEAELRQVTDLVLEHARMRPDRSLAVLTLTAEHARKVMERVMRSVAVIPSLRDFFDAQAEECFTVVPAAQAGSVVRDEVIVSIGFGKTPHGRLLHRFGPLSGPGGRKALATVVSRSRGRTTVVAGFGAEDLDPQRLRTEGGRDLRALLSVLQGGRDDEVEAELPAARDPFAPADEEGPVAGGSAGPSSAAGTAAEREGEVAFAGLESRRTGVASGRVRADEEIDAAIAAQLGESGALAHVAEEEGSAAAGAGSGDPEAGSGAASAASEAREACGTGPDSAVTADAVVDARDPEASDAAGSDEPRAIDGAVAVGGPESAGGSSAESGSAVDEDGVVSGDAGADAAADGDAAAVSDADADAEADAGDGADEPGEQDEAPASEAADPAEEPHLETNALVNDLADRLWRRGAVVETEFGSGEDSIELALGHRDLPGRYLLAVDTDGERYVATPSQRERDRLRAERLESFGWATERVWSWALFIDPEGEAERIQQALERALHGYRQQLEAAAEDGAGSRHRLPRPQIPPSRPLSFYSSEDFDAVVEWVVSDGRARREEQLAAEVRSFLGFLQRSVLLDVSVSSAIRRYQERQG